MTLLTGQNDYRRRAFTLIELVFVLALLVIVTSITAPAMSRFIRGRALDSEARRLLALTHEAQSRAVSEGLAMMFWVDEKADSYGFASETSGPTGDPKGENLTADATVMISVLSVGAVAGQPTTFKNLPAIRFQPDGTIDESSPQTLKLTDSDGFSRWLVENSLRTGYDITAASP